MLSRIMNCLYTSHYCRCATCTITNARSIINTKASVILHSIVQDIAHSQTREVFHITYIAWKRANTRPKASNAMFTSIRTPAAALVQPAVAVPLHTVGEGPELGIAVGVTVGSAL